MEHAEMLKILFRYEGSEDTRRSAQFVKSKSHIIWGHYGIEVRVQSPKMTDPSHGLSFPED